MKFVYKITKSNLLFAVGLLAALLRLATAADAQVPRAAWQTEWEKVQEEAKKEGGISLWGPPGGWARSVLIDEFHKKFSQIQVEYQGALSAAAWPKIQAERQAGIFTIDILVGGVGATALYKAKAQQPIESTFILPEIKDKKAWWQGRLHFADPEDKFIFIFSIGPIPVIAYNTQHLDPKDLKFYKDLLDPKWKGKIVMIDPRVAGSGNARWHFFVEALGRDYVERLAKQLVLTRDFRLAAEWIATGKYPIGVGVSYAHVAEFIKKGAPVSRISHLAEGNYLTSGWGTVSLLDRAPHPNSAKLYINWLLSKEGQLAWQKTGYNSARMDISKESVDPMNRIVEGVQYYEQFSESASTKRDEVSNKLAKEIFRD